jgi:hypothetical protein
VYINLCWVYDGSLRIVSFKTASRAMLCYRRSAVCYVCLSLDVNINSSTFLFFSALVGTWGLVIVPVFTALVSVHSIYRWRLLLPAHITNDCPLLSCSFCTGKLNF